MPKRPARLPEGRYPQRDRFVTRLIEEQERMNWSDSRVAEKASQFFPMTSATVWKIKSLEPPRRVDLDEAYAIARAFGHKSLDEFLVASDGPSKITEAVDWAAATVDDITKLPTFKEVSELLRANADAVRSIQRLEARQAGRMKASSKKVQLSLQRTGAWLTTEIAETEASLEQFKLAVTDTMFTLSTK